MIPDESRVLIKAENLSKFYKLGKETVEAFKDIDIKVMQGEFVIIEGLNGALKSIFINLIGCLEKPTIGKYYFDYEDIALANTDVLDSIRKHKLGYIFRDLKLINRMTAAQNLEVPMQGLAISKEEKRNIILKVLKKFDLEEIADRKVSELLDFQKQLVSFARAMINDPLLIIADEPTANLDAKEEQKVMEHLLKLNSEGVAIMLITEKTTLKGLNKYRLISFEGGTVLEDKEAYKLSLIRREA